MEWAEVLKIYGPMSIGWIIAAYLGKWILDRIDKWLDRDLKLAVSLESLTTAIREKLK